MWFYPREGRYAVVVVVVVGAVVGASASIVGLVAHEPPCPVGSRRISGHALTVDSLRYRERGTARVTRRDIVIHCARNEPGDVCSGHIGPRVWSSVQPTYFGQYGMTVALLRPQK